MIFPFSLPVWWGGEILELNFYGFHWPTGGAFYFQLVPTTGNLGIDTVDVSETLQKCIKPCKLL